MRKRIYYDEYRLSVKERFIAIAIPAILLYAVGMIFFQHIFLSIAIACLAIFYPRVYVKNKIIQRKEELKRQFQQALYMLSSSLSAGRSLESSFPAVLQDLKMLYPDENTLITAEFADICIQLRNGSTVEKALSALSERAQISELSQFVDVLIVCKRTGGNLVEVVRTSSRMISDKMQIQQQIGVMISQKKLESKILGVVPIAIVAFLVYSSPDYMAPMYEGIGRLIMGLSLMLLIACQLWSRKLMDIDI